MLSSEEKKNWIVHQIKIQKLFKEGILESEILPYDSTLIYNLRNIYFENIPLSIWLLCLQKCEYYCYDRAVLISLGFGNDDFLLIDADVDTLRLNPENIIQQKNNDGVLYFTHRFALRKCSDGSLWVYDTSRGLVFDKDLYFEIENPTNIKIAEKKEITETKIYKDLKYNEPDIEEAYRHLEDFENLVPTETLYKEQLKTEIELFKLHLNYLKSLQKNKTQLT